MRATNPALEIAGTRSRRGGAVLLLVLVGCVLLLSARAPARNRRGSMLQSWILSAVAPAARAVAAVSRAVTGAADSAAQMLQATSENAVLRQRLSERERELFRLRAAVAQAERDRLLANASAALPSVVASAPVLLLERRAGLQSALVAAGSREGAVEGSPLAVPEGLVGRIVTVGRSMSRAQLLTDVSAAAGARIVRTGELGVVRGDGRGALRLNNVPITSSVAAGDAVESAGIDGIYPRGVPIGRVESVGRGNSLFLEIRVRPAADFSRLMDVLVLAPSPAGEGAGRSRSAAP
ncbi:MAG: rod shape-determining protein MreC [Thermoanaerobaculia bacterium]